MRYHQRRLQEDQNRRAMLAEMMEKMHDPDVSQKTRDLHLADVHASTGEDQVDAALTLRASVVYDLKYIERMRRRAA